MSVQKEEKAAIMAEHARSEGATGSVEVQVAVLTRRIKNLTAHLQTHRKDVSTRRGLVSMVARRSSLLKYLKKKDATRHAELVQKLGIRG